MRDEDYGNAAVVVSECLGIDVRECDVKAWVGGFGKDKIGGLHDGDWSDCTWLMWFRNRIKIPFGCCATDRDESLFTTEMHVFFVFIEETQEMMARLRTGHGVATGGPARSKISTTQLAEVQPIDRVAGMVVVRGEGS